MLTRTYVIVVYSKTCLFRATLAVDCQRSPSTCSASSNWNFEEVGSEFSGSQERLALPEHYKRWASKSTPPWKQFHKDWWGPPGKKRLEQCMALPASERVLRINQNIVYSKFHILTDTNGALLLRNEILYALERIQCASGNREVGVVVLTGQTGIGKSSALVYFLLARMADRRPTLLTTSGKRTYLFVDIGVWEMSSSQFDFEEDLSLPDTLPDKSDRVWSLIDSPWSREEPSDSSIWLTESLPYMFPVQTVSPDEARYKESKNANIRFSNRFYITDPWNLKDMVAWLTLSSNQPANMPDKECVRNVMHNIGPIPSDVFHHLVDTEGRRIYRGSFTRFNNIDSLVKNILSYFSFCDSRSCDQAFVMRRFEHKGKSDRVLLDFKAQFMEENITAQFGLLGLEEVERLFSVCPFPERSELAGWFFEGVAVHLLSGNASHARCGLAELRRMRLMESLTPDPEPGVHGPRFVEDDSSISRSEGHILYVDPRGSLPKNGKVISRDELQITPCQSSLPSRKRTIMEISKVSSEGLYRSHYTFAFVTKRDNPLVDGLSWEMLYDQQKIVIWVFKFVNAKFQGEGSAGFDAIRTVKTEAKTHSPHVELRYVLVAPKRDKTPVVVWKLPDGWADDVQGDLYVQYIDLT